MVQCKQSISLADCETLSKSIKTCETSITRKLLSISRISVISCMFWSLEASIQSKQPESVDLRTGFLIQWNSNLADWTGQHQIVHYFGVVRYFWTSDLLHKLTIFHCKLHFCYLEAMKWRIWLVKSTLSQIIMAPLQHAFRNKFRITHTFQ